MKVSLLCFPLLLVPPRKDSDFHHIERSNKSLKRKIIQHTILTRELVGSIPGEGQVGVAMGRDSHIMGWGACQKF